MAGDFVSLESDEGWRLLREAPSVDYAPLATYFEGQDRLRFCSVASSVIALNALLDRREHSQQAFFASGDNEHVSETHVEEQGMTLDEFAVTLTSRGAQVSVYHAQPSGMPGFRRRAAANLNRSGDFVIVNYLREALDQSGGGHFSPLGAWHPETDRFLILDVAEDRYPPLWVRTERLYHAMCTVDALSGKTRGYVALTLPADSRLILDELPPSEWSPDP